MAEKRITPKSAKEWRGWLKKNHLKEKKVYLIKYKKHTGKNSITNQEAMREAICFGWIDTTIKRLDDEKYQQCFVRRTDKSTWSNNTLKYAKELKKQGKMSPFGLKMFKEGLKKGMHDDGIPRNPDMPEELKKRLEKNKKAKEYFDKFSPSMKKMYYIWILQAKRKETAMRRINQIIQMCRQNKGKSIFLEKLDNK